MNKKVPIGELIQKKLTEERRSVAWLAEKLCCNRSSVYKIFQKSYIDTGLLLKISLALNFDFFSYYSKIFHEKQDDLQVWKSPNWRQIVPFFGTKMKHFMVISF